MPDKVSFVLPLDLDGIPPGSRQAFRSEVADYIQEAILSDVARGISPVTGRQFRGLSRAYKKIKSQEHASPVANLELTGDMLDALRTKSRADAIETGIFTHAQAAKAAGHNHTSGWPSSGLPVRKFIPDAAKSETFRPGIMQEISRIREEYTEK